MTDAAFYWSLFLDTGAPEAYLAYKAAAQNEGKISA